MFLGVRSYLYLEGSLVEIPELSTAITVIVTVLFSFGFIAYLNQASTRDLREALDDATFNLMEVNKQLEEASERKSQFTARTSHELRTPLSAIIVFADLALREAYGPIDEKLRNAQQHIVNSARHLKRVINDLLDLSKIEAGQLEVKNQQFKLKDISNIIESTCRPMADQKGLKWSVFVDPLLPMILTGDAERISQIAVNICGNAVKFTDEGHVEVRIEKEDEESWKIIVSDSGPGIPVDEQEVVFEAFRSMDKGRSKSVTKGTGLGLAIARNLVEMMGGEITLQSQLGVGSTFEVYLPFRPLEVLEDAMVASE
jgi:signal transduction histidine kinase